jgi:hypothetical protein
MSGLEKEKSMKTSLAEGDSLTQTEPRRFDLSLLLAFNDRVSGMQARFEVDLINPTPLRHRSENPKKTQKKHFEVDDFGRHSYLLASRVLRRA